MGNYNPQDKWMLKAKKEGYRARSVYKLQELDEKFGLLSPGMKVIDAGAAPGSWMQYTAKKIGSVGKVVGLDIQPVEHVADNATTFVCDIFDAPKVQECMKTAGIEKADIVLSDIAPSTSGIKDVDQWRSVELNRAVMAMARTWLRRGGTIVMKVFRGADFDEFMADVRKIFPKVKVATVAASRDSSREVYVVGFGKR